MARVPPARWYGILELGHAHFDRLEAPDGSGVEHLDLPPQRLAADVSTMVDVPGHPAPGVEPIQGVRPLEDLLGGAVDAAAQEPPDGGVDEVHLLAGQGCADGLHEPLRADGFKLLMFRPLEDALENRAPGDEVAL